MKFLLLIVSVIAVSSAQIYQPIPYAHQQQQAQPQLSLAHRAVIENALREAEYPPEFVNNFYKDPRIVDALAKSSWLTDKEMPVFDREADKIPREQVYKLFKNAGFIKRR